MSRSYRVFTRCSLLLVTMAVAWAQQLPPPPPPPPQQVAILRQINHVNDDGSYTYGYEAADGSFKIETRDVLGTVRGMFGFVDESGRQRRVSYTAGNTTGFQTTRQPGAEEGGDTEEVTTRRASVPRVFLRPVRPFLTAQGGGQESVAKLIQHLGIIRTKEAASRTSDEASHTTVAPKSTTAASDPLPKENGKSDDITTRRPTVVQRILRTRPRARKEEPMAASLRNAAPQSKRRDEETKKEEGRSATVDSRQKQPLVALKVSENAGVPRFVVLPSRILRWRPSAEEDYRKAHTGEERTGFRPETLLRSRSLDIAGPRDNFQYQLRQLSREQLAESQPPLQIFAQKSDPSSNFQDQQFLPQKNVYAFVTSTPRPRLVRPQTLPVSTHSSIRVNPEDVPAMYRQVYEPTASPHETTRLLFHDGNYAEKIQHPQAYLQHHQMVYQQKPVVYNADPRRYDAYYPRSNAYLPNLQTYPYYGPQDLLELLLSYLQLQSKSSHHQNGFTNPLPYDPNINILQRQELPQTGTGYQSPTIVIPYPTQHDQYQNSFRNVPLGTNGYDFRRFLGQRTLLRPSLRQQLEVQNTLARPILYGNGFDVPYIKNKGNGYPEDLYVDTRGGRVNPQQEVALRPTHLHLQPLFLEEASKGTVTPRQPEFSMFSTRQGNAQPKFTALGVTTVAPRSTSEAPTSTENQGLPYGFTKKFRSVQVIGPETDDASEKSSKND